MYMVTPTVAYLPKNSRLKISAQGYPNIQLSKIEIFDDVLNTQEFMCVETLPLWGFR